MSLSQTLYGTKTSSSSAECELWRAFPACVWIFRLCVALSVCILVLAYLSYISHMIGLGSQQLVKIKSFFFIIAQNIYFPIVEGNPSNHMNHLFKDNDL